ncbi:MAG TPA: YceI family protein [Candidatus Dormibacteraeota bacterium]|nr:YceI family protein [Candidatus Dormibacteraeota bacterium]
MAQRSITLGPGNGSVKFRTFRDGLASKAGHDLVLGVDRWSATLDGDSDDPSSSRVTATLDLRSISIQQATGGVKPLSDGDRKDIIKNLEKTLNVGQNPEVTFRTTGVNAGGVGSVDLSGTITLSGKSSPIRFQLQRQSGMGGERLTGTVPILHSAFGIKPYSGLLGALKIKDEVLVDVDVNVPTA